MRQIKVGEIAYVYFIIYMFDGTPALSEAGGQPEISINDSPWGSTGISPLEEIGFGQYRALLSSFSVGTIIHSHYISPNTLDSFGEDIEIVSSLVQTPIFESSPIPTILSYVSLSEAENYFSSRLKSDSWYNASQKDKIISLNQATRDIEQLNFNGIKADQNQLLEFPRVLILSYFGIPPNFDPYHNIPAIPVVSDPIFPIQIKYACCEIAYNYLDGIEIEAEMNRLIVNNSNYSGVSESYSSVNEAKRAGINSNRGWIYLKPYLNSGYELKLTLR